MIDTGNMEGVYLVGIGGIGMSALARYFITGGYAVAGYDRSETSLTRDLTREGCLVSYEDNPVNIPFFFRGGKSKERLLVVYTPAIPPENQVLSFFRGNGYNVHKRSEVLGAITALTDTIAIAGTHGKTTVSAMTAHILKHGGTDCTAFLGGISKNYGSNLIRGKGKITVIEADEYDRSFHTLKPLVAVITSIDADHLEIYGDHDSMIDGYNEFCSKIRDGGTLVVNWKIRTGITCPGNVKLITYGSDNGADYRYFDIERGENGYTFSLQTPVKTFRGLRLEYPGLINIENITAAVATAFSSSADVNSLHESVATFKGARRRFDIRVNLPGVVYIDDYAHHPEEIKACVNSLRDYFRGRKITGIFQPHLFSRTRDHAEGFARILDTLDEVILLPVYPAREEPLPGITSRVIFDRMKLGKKYLMEMSDIPGRLDRNTLDVLVTIGAGDIDKLAVPIEKWLGKEEEK